MFKTFIITIIEMFLNNLLSRVYFEKINIITFRYSFYRPYNHTSYQIIL
jgi:hypothetical protein